MPIFYHIHTAYEPNSDTLEDGFQCGVPLFMSKKNSWWYEMKINDGKPKDNYKGGHTVYKITIPTELFTSSLHPKEKNKILKITKNNIDEYIKYLDLHCDGTFQSELTKRNIIGVDATNKIVTKYKYRKHKLISPPEARIWKKLPQIKIKKIETVTY